MREISHTVSIEDDGRLIRRVARSRIMLSHRQFTSLKAKNGLLLDGVPVHADHVVRAGQVITVLLDEGEAARSISPVEGPVDIVYRDEDILVIDKQAPLPTMSGLEGGDSLEARLCALFGEGYVFRPVNRLDKGTSGLMAVALHAHAQQALQRYLHSPSFVREYVAVADGLVESDEGVIDAPIGKADGATVRRVVRPDGRDSVTRYAVLERRLSHTLLRLRLETGRTHQIRVHLAHIGHPVTGDFLYGREDGRLIGRFALHSASLELIHPVTGEEMRFFSPAPEVFGAIMNDDE